MDTSRLCALTLSALALLQACATGEMRSTGDAVTSANSLIQMPHYSIVIPADQAWRRLPPPQPAALVRDLEMLYVTQREGPYLRTIFIVRNTILSSEMQGATAKTIADDYRRREVEEMVEKGVWTKRYELSGVKNGEESVGGKTFYTMNYTTTASARAGTQVVIRSTLFLYLPQDRENRIFISAVFAETDESGDNGSGGGVPAIPISRRPDVIEALATLTLR